MKSKVAKHVVVLIALIGIFVAGYYTALLSEKPVRVEGEKAAISPAPAPSEEELLIPLWDPYLLFGIIKGVDKTKSPAEMKMIVNLRATFKDASYAMMEKKILIDKDTRIFVGLSAEKGEEEIRTLVDINALKIGRDVIVNTKESILWFLVKDAFSAQEIKMLVSEEEYKSYLK